jgi:hypothetical protein
MRSSKSARNRDIDVDRPTDTKRRLPFRVDDNISYLYHIRAMK